MRKAFVTAIALVLPLVAAAQIQLVSGYNFGQFIGGGYPSLDGVTFAPVGSIGSNFRLNVQAPNTSDGGFVGANGNTGGYTNGFGTIFWDGTNGSTAYDFTAGLQIVATDVLGTNAINGQTMQGYTIAAQGDSLNLALTSALADGRIAFVQNTTGYSDYDADAIADIPSANDSNLTFAASVNAPVTISWYLNGSATPFTTTSLSGATMTSYSVDLPAGFYGQAAAQLVAKFSGTATIDNVQFNGFFGTPPASGLTFWKGSDGVWSVATTPTNWRDSVGGTTEGVWAGGEATFGGTTTGTTTVTVDSTGGDVVFTGAKFLSDGYVVAALTGSTLKTVTDSTTLQVANAMTATISAPITGTGGINKTDLGTLILSGANTYAGTTTVTAGKLAINGAQTGTGAVTVKTGGTLTGSGSTSAAVTVENGGALAGGTGATLTTGALTLGASSNVNVTLGAPGTTEFFRVNGNLTLDGTLNASFTTGFANGLYRLFDYTGGTLTDSGLAIGTVPGATTDFVINTSTANQVNLLVDSTSLFWAGGSGNWVTGGAGWNNAANAPSSYSSNFTIFNSGTGTVTVENAGVGFKGAQFVTDGYIVTGGALTTTISSTDIRVGSGKTATIASVIAGTTGGVNKRDPGTLVLTGTNTYGGGTTVSEGTLQLGAGGATGSVAGNITNNATVVFDLTGTPAYAGVISGTGTVKKQGAATLVLSGANTYTGGTTVSAGTLSIGSGATSGSIAGNAVVETGATLAFNRSDASTYAGAVSGAGAVTKLGTGTLSLTGASTHTGGTTVSAGTLSIGSGGTTGSMAGNITNSATVAFNRSDASTYAGIISGTGAVTKLGAGTTTLTGINTYTGATTVSAGKLLINGAQTTATGAITVEQGGTLGGTGTTGGIVTVANGGTLAGQTGDVPFTMAGLILNDTSNIDVTLGAPNSKRLFQVNGALTLDGLLNITAGTGFGEGTYRLFDYTGALTGTATSMTIGTAPGLKSSYTVKTDTAKQVNLSVTSTTLPYWTGESTVWSVSPTTGGWGSDGEGADAGGWLPGRAIFKGDGTNITVDTTDGAVIVKGIEFHADGFIVEGDPLTNNTANAPFQVGIIGAAADAAITAEISSNIIGTGGVDKTGPGALVLTGTNTYTGGTRISGGTLEVATDTALGGPAGALRLAGGTLRAGANLTSARSVAITATGSAIDTGANSVTLSGIISGSGALTKRGTGSLTVTGVNTNTGVTTVSEGALILNASSLGATTVAQGARLTGTGTIRGNLANSGTLAPGASPGTITIVGNFTQSAGGTYAVELASATSHDKLVVSGTATLAGTLTVTGLNGFVPGTGQTFKIIEATGGRTGTFDTIVSPWSQVSAMRKFQAFYGANDVSLGFLQLPFAGISGATANQKAIGAAVDGALADGTIPTLGGTLNSLPTTAAVLAAIETLSPQRYERWLEQGVYQAAATIRLAENHMTARAGTRRKDSEGQGGLWLEMVRRETRFDANETEGSAQARGTSDGIVVGGDIPLSRLWQMGVLFGYTNENIELDTAGSSTAAERFNAALYARLSTPLFLEAVAGTNYAKLDSRRTVAADKTNPVVAESKVDSGERYLGLRTGFPFRIGQAHVTPYMAMNYVRWTADGATESGAGNANLTLSDQSADSLTSRTGFAMAWPFAGKNITVTPRLDLAWWHEFRGDPRTISAELGGNLFSVQTRTPSSSGMTAGFGLDATFGSRFSAYARFASEWATTVDESLEARAGVDYRF